MEGRREENNMTSNDRQMDGASGTRCMFCLIHKLMRGC